MLFKKKLVIGLGLIGIVTLSNKVLAYNFNYGTGEQEIINTDLTESERWIFKNNSIDFSNGKLQAKSSWGKAAYPLDSLSLEEGDIFVYWRGLFPQFVNQSPNQYVELNKYFVGLKFLENLPVFSGETQIIEPAEVKVEMRPKHPTNPGDRFNRLYVDPGFNIPHTAETKFSNFNLVNITDYRLQLSKIDDMTHEAITFYWENNQWKAISSLLIDASDWINSQGNSEMFPNFEALSVQFRSPGAWIEDIALTQVIPTAQIEKIPLIENQLFSEEELIKVAPVPQIAQVPESSLNLGLLVMGCLSVGSAIKKKRERNKLAHLGN